MVVIEALCILELLGQWVWRWEETFKGKTMHIFAPLHTLSPVLWSLFWGGKEAVLYNSVCYPSTHSFLKFCLETQNFLSELQSTEWASFFFFFFNTLSSGIHMQVCYLGIHVPWCPLPFSLWPPYLNRRTTPDAGMVAFQVEGPHTCCLGLCLASRWEPGHVWWRPSLLQPSLARSQRAAGRTDSPWSLHPPRSLLAFVSSWLLLMPKRYWLSWHQALF